MNKRINGITTFILALALGPVVANADPVEWKVVDGGNGHFYEVVTAPSITWPAAKDAASSSAESYLVTITSAAENAFLVNTFALVGKPYWMGGIQVGGPEPAGGWEWITGEAWSYTNWAGGEPNNSGNNEHALALAFFSAEGTWNDAPALHDYGAGAGYIVESDPTEAVVEEGEDVLFFNQANVPGSPNPLTGAYQEVLPSPVPISNTVKIACCRVLDTRPLFDDDGDSDSDSDSDGNQGNFDLGLATADTLTNASCQDTLVVDGTPKIAPGTAIMRSWQRGTLRSNGLVGGVPTDTNGGFDSNGYPYRERDIGVCFIEADVLIKGVAYTEEEAANVLGYSVDCAALPVEDRPFTAGVTTSVGDRERDFPDLSRWTAECDKSRSGKRHSNNVMVVNMTHDLTERSTKKYLKDLAKVLERSIKDVRSEGCVVNSDGFLDDLLSLVKNARKDMGKKGASKHQKAVNTLDDATRLALLIPTIFPGSPTSPSPPMDPDPYGIGLSACAGNPKGLFVGRLMALKGAACSELLQSGPGENAKSPANCGIAGDILFELPELPAPPMP